ncbi:unnamed protein product [Rotaria sordida]|uniref:Major facilitator superfamily (MFS) profile domain-containing protein n=1 Tax=Rotaria sordida TaxID=392033 RepID=A0A815EKT1_9BILA|nr:unnamed protein product [Rotaria sordida]CAF3986746.1 unnamed protein product [Rotaria sordida]
MKFDDFLHTINDFGRYQKLRYIFICLTYMLPPIMVYTWSFTAAKPSFRCKLFDNDTIFNNDIPSLINQSQPDETYCKTNMKISVGECQRCYRKVVSETGTTHIEPCKEFVFDRKYYQYTLVEEWLMVCDRTIFRSIVQNIFFFGYMVGSIFFGIFADKYGRRPIMSACILLMVVTGFICAFFPQKKAFGFWPSYIVYTISRFILACSTRGISVTGSIFAFEDIITELVGPKNKFLTAISVKYFFAIGQLFLVAFAYFIREWRRLSWTLSIFTIPFVFFHFVLPESARWMMSKRHYTKAEKLLRHIAKTNKRPFDEEAFNRMKNEQEKSTLCQSQQIGVLALFQTKIMFIISINLFFQWFVQNLVFYGISQSTGSWGFNPYLSFTISALVEILSCIAIHPLLNRVGRKLPYFIAALCFSIIALLIIPMQNLILKNKQRDRVLTFIWNVLLKFFASGSYNIIYIYANELFPTRIRNTGMGICSMVARIGAIVGTTSNDMLTRVWINLPTILYGILSLLAALSVLILPETLNKTLPQTIEDTEQMGLVCIRIRGVQRTLDMEEEQSNKKEYPNSNDIHALKSTCGRNRSRNGYENEKRNNHLIDEH